MYTGIVCTSVCVFCTCVYVRECIYVYGNTETCILGECVFGGMGMFLKPNFMIAKSFAPSFNLLLTGAAIAVMESLPFMTYIRFMTCSSE